MFPDDRLSSSCFHVSQFHGLECEDIISIAVVVSTSSVRTCMFYCPMIFRTGLAMGVFCIHYNSSEETVCCGFTLMIIAKMATKGICVCCVLEYFLVKYFRVSVLRSLCGCKVIAFKQALLSRTRILNAVQFFNCTIFVVHRISPRTLLFHFCYCN